MSTVNFDQLLQTLKTGAENVAEQTVQDYRNEAKQDGRRVIDDMKQNLQQWTQELETGSITAADLRYLMAEDEDLCKMTALKQAGLAEVHIDEFRNNMINMVVGTLTGLIKI